MKHNKIISNIILSIFILIIMLILLEIFLNLFPKFTFYYIYPSELFENAEAPLDFRMTPNFIGKMVGEYDIDIRTNSNGLRDYEHEQTSDNFRILALGDSFAFGQGVDINDTFLSIIEKQLDVEIIKAGVPAYGQDNQLHYFITKGKNYNPDMTIIFYFLNDNEDNYGLTDRKVAYGNLIQKYRYEALPNWKLYTYTKLFRTKTLRLIRQTFSNIATYFDENKKTKSFDYKVFLKSQTKESREWTKTAALFKEFKKNSGNSKLLIVYVPDKKQIYPEEFKDFFDINTDVDKPNKVLKTVAEFLNISYIDVTKEMRNLKISNLYFRHDPHFNENGYKLFAILVGNELIKYTED
ncbi:MAG: SGNH/GDSL hydrolase family protein [Nanoarchaeota archaeon]|nr:SGNH/GDSL hydrolase family protein [Nanoarchaeota archaeon]